MGLAMNTWTSYQWISLAQSLIITLAMLFVWSLRAGIKSGRWLSSGDAQTERLIKLENRMDQAGKKSSDLADIVQALPEKIRVECDRAYMPHAVSEERWAGIRQRADGLDDRIRRLETDRTDRLERELHEIRKGKA
jgi:hypothetical protein